MTPYYEDDLVTLYHGDCREVLAAHGPMHFDAVVTDPPYGETSLSWDRWPEGWPTLMAEYANSMWCFGSMRMFLTQQVEFTSAGWRLSQDVVWHKNVTSFNPGDRFNRVHEHVLHWYRGDWRDVYHVPGRVPAVKRQAGDVITRSANEAGVVGARGAHTAVSDGLAYVSSVLAAKVARSESLHPTEKPVGVLRHLITYACPSGGYLLDPFAGSGSTLRAAKDLGRHAVGIEADERYCEIAAQRLAQGALDFGEAS